MTAFLTTMIDKARADKKTIVLPEGNDERVLEAAQEIARQGIADLIVLGKPDEIAAKGFDLEGVKIIDPATSELREELTSQLYELRRAKGLTQEQAASLMDEVMYFGTMLVKAGYADGLVGGACHATKDMLSPALRIIKPAPGTSTVSSFFVIEVPDCSYGDAGTFMFSDCAVCIQPSAEELADIAVATAASYERMVGNAARVALLSHATYGSVKDEDADKVVKAATLAKEKAPHYAIDGELQADAALVPQVGTAKAPGSKVAGSANVLVFPDLDAANIGYKLVQRLAKAEAYGPILQGLAAPMNDLSRGCSVEDIVGVTAITAVQAQG